MINIIEVLVLLYNTENNFDTEEIDCIYHTQESTGKYFKQFDILLLTSRHPNNSLNIIEKVRIYQIALVLGNSHVEFK